MKILLVEDDADLRSQLVYALTSRGYVIEEADNGEDALYLGREFPYDLAIVDLGLPKINGVEVIRTWRAENKNFPVLILTARGDWQDKVEGLEAGADDYLVKPFHIAELSARVNALLRRAAGHASPQLEFGPLSLDTAGRVASKNGTPLNLTSYEYRTLEYLMLHAGKTISKAQLTEHLYHQDYDRDSNVLEVFIRRLRQKIDPDQTLKPITTVRGMGYRFELNEAQD
ncbi:MAG: response regulator transcription factor [Pontibacterium sp.]